MSVVYSASMNPTLEKQFASVVEGRSNLADIQTPKGNAVLLSEKLCDRFRPLLEYMARQIAVEALVNADNDWTEEKNCRRMALIEKKYEGVLTAAEKRELKSLQQEGEQYANHIAAPRNEMLELLLLGLQQKASQQKSSQ